MTTFKQLSCFKTYDIRGKLHLEINEKIAFRIGYATAKKLKARTVVVGYDARQSSPSLANSVIDGIKAYGADVLSLGLAGTEEVYHAVAYFDADAGIEVTASHNPIDYNGMKIVKVASQPLNEDEFLDIKFIAEKDDIDHSESPGKFKDFGEYSRKTYIKKILSFVTLSRLKPLKIVLNSGNGVAGIVVDELERYLKDKVLDTQFIKVHHRPNPSFPHGIPNPLLEENRAATSEAVQSVGADFGVAFDGDFDRCFLFDNAGNFIPSEYIVGMLSEVFLNKEKGATIIHDPRVIFNTSDVINTFGGNAVVAKTGHAFLKAAMRAQNAIYGGEMSAHHYFRDFNYCDSGMIPWLLVWEFISSSGSSLGDLVKVRRDTFPSSGEINFIVDSRSEAISRILAEYHDEANEVDKTDGVSLKFDDWRFNVRKSNTEPLIRLNVESKGDTKILHKKIEHLERLIGGTKL